MVLNNSYTVQIDSTAPVVYQFNVSSIASDGAIVTFNVSDASSIANCTAYISGTGIDNTTTINTSANNTIAITGLTDAIDYTSVVNCTDVSGNIGNSSTLNFTTSASAATTTTTTGSSGSGRGGTPTYFPTEDQLERGYTASLGKHWKLKFKLVGEDHQFILDEIFLNKIQATISSDPIEFELGVGETEKFDLNNDEVYDLKINLSKLATSRATISLQSINERIVNASPAEENPFEDEGIDEGNIRDSRWDLPPYFKVIGIVLVLFILGVIVWIILRKNKRKMLFI